MTNLQLRVLTAVVAVPILLAALYVSEVGYGIVFSGISLLCLNEFYGLLKQNGAKPSASRGILLAILILLITYGVAALQIPSKWMMLIAPQIAVVFIQKLYKKDEHPIEDLALTFFGIVYTVVPFALLHLATFRNGTYNAHIPIGILALLWASDTGAYFAGRAFGKHKLFERVSPKKTWEGLAGGFFAAAAISFILAYFFTDIPLLHWCLLMVIVVVAGTFGDLTESLFKRSLAIKDSGKSLPGHGGFLDRFDGLLIALPFVCTLLLLLP